MQVKKAVLGALNGGLDVAHNNPSGLLVSNQQSPPICCITLEPLLCPVCSLHDFGDHVLKLQPSLFVKEMSMSLLSLKPPLDNARFSIIVTVLPENQMSCVVHRRS